MIRKSHRHGRIQPVRHPVYGRRLRATARGTSRRNCPFKTSTTGWLTTFIRSTLFGRWLRVSSSCSCRPGSCSLRLGSVAQRIASHTAAMNLYDLPPGWLCVLHLRLRYRMGQLVERSCAARLVRVAWSRSFGAEQRLGMGAAVDAAGKATGAFTYGIIGTTGWFLNGAVE